MSFKIRSKKAMEVGKQPHGRQVGHVGRRKGQKSVQAPQCHIREALQVAAWRTGFLGKYFIKALFSLVRPQMSQLFWGVNS